MSYAESYRFSENITDKPRVLLFNAGKLVKCVFKGKRRESLYYTNIIICSYI